MAKKQGGDSTIVKKTSVTFVPLKKETAEQKEKRMANAPLTNEQKKQKYGLGQANASEQKRKDALKIKVMDLPSVAYEKDLEKRKKNNLKNY